MEEILEILEQNSRYSDEQIAVMVGMPVEEVRRIIKEYEEKSIIAGYTTLVNWENTGREMITAIIQIKVVPQRGDGFDKVAERIYKFPQVKACYLMSSGDFDLSVIVEGKTMKEVALFVSNKLACQEYVSGTATHFVLKIMEQYLKKRSLMIGRIYLYDFRKYDKARSEEYAAIRDKKIF